MKNSQNSYGSYEPYWELSGVSDHEPLLIRNVLKYKGALLEIDKWIPFPQNCCCFTFGDRINPDIEYPLPLCILIYLWDHWDAFTGECPACGGAVYGYGFGGLLSRGGIIGCCIQCESRFFKFQGGLGNVGNLVKGVLEHSPYELKKGLLGGAYKGERAPLVSALKSLGVNDLPGDDWVLRDQPCHVSMSIKVGHNPANGE